IAEGKNGHVMLAVIEAGQLARQVLDVNAGAAVNVWRIFVGGNGDAHGHALFRLLLLRFRLLSIAVSPPRLVQRQARLIFRLLLFVGQLDRASFLLNCLGESPGGGVGNGERIEKSRVLPLGQLASLASMLDGLNRIAFLWKWTRRPQPGEV